MTLYERLSDLAVEISGSFGSARIESPLVGAHNAENLLVAWLMARAAGVHAAEAAEFHWLRTDEVRKELAGIAPTEWYSTSRSC